MKTGPALSPEEEEAPGSSPRLLHAGVVEHKGDAAGFPGQTHQRSHAGLGAAWSSDPSPAVPQSQGCQNPWERRAPGVTTRAGAVWISMPSIQLSGWNFGTLNSHPQCRPLSCMERQRQLSHPSSPATWIHQETIPMSKGCIHTRL